MTLMTVWRNAKGELRNIGEWEYQLYQPDPESPEMIPANPMPEGYVSSQEEVVVGWDGGRYLADDPRQYEPGSTS